MEFERHVNENLESARNRLQFMRQFSEERNINPVLDNIAIVGVLVRDFRQYTQDESENIKLVHNSDMTRMYKNFLDDIAAIRSEVSTLRVDYRAEISVLRGQNSSLQQQITDLDKR